MTNYILAFDTSIQTCSVALLNNNKLLFLLKEDKPGMQAELLLPMVEEVMKSAKLQYQDLTAIALSIGPGSFTGIRIGVAVAKGFRIATGLPIIAVTTLEALASRTTQLSMAVIDAYRNQLYVQIFSSNGAAVTEPQVLDYLKAAEIAPREPFYLVGNGSHLLLDQLTMLGKPYEHLAELAHFDASHVAFTANKTTNNHYLAPLYIRDSSAKLAQILVPL